MNELLYLVITQKLELKIKCFKYVNRLQCSGKIRK